MPNILCCKCQVQMRPKRNGVDVVLCRLEDGEQVPYQVRSADLYACPKCGFEVVTGYAQSPYLHPDSQEFWERVYGENPKVPRFFDYVT